MWIAHSRHRLTLALIFALADHIVLAQAAQTSSLKVILLGTAAGPPPNPQRFGISTLVIAGSDRLPFGVGRAATPSFQPQGPCARPCPRASSESAPFWHQHPRNSGQRPAAVRLRSRGNHSHEPAWNRRGKRHKAVSDTPSFGSRYGNSGSLPERLGGRSGSKDSIA